MICHHTPTTTHIPLVLAKLGNVSAEMCEYRISPHEAGEIWSHFHLINYNITDLGYAEECDIQIIGFFLSIQKTSVVLNR